MKDAIEAQGVPHPEVDLILLNGSPVSFDHALTPGDRVSVYPWIQSLPRPANSLRPPVPAPHEAVEEQVPPGARSAHDTFVQCPSCGSVYWPGSHVERMQELLEDVLAATRDASDLDADSPQ